MAQTQSMIQDSGLSILSYLKTKILPALPAAVCALILGRCLLS